VTDGASTVLTPVSDPRGGSWSTDGTIAFAESLGPLQGISEDGGTRSPLTTLAATETNHRWPRFLPEGRKLLFFVQGERPGVYVTALDGNGEKQRIVDASLDAACVPPQGDGPGYVLMVQGDSLVAQPFDIDSMRVGGPPVNIPGAENTLAFTDANRLPECIDGDGRCRDQRHRCAPDSRLHEPSVHNVCVEWCDHGRR